MSLSTTQALGLGLLAFLTWTNTRGLDWGRAIQNVFTTAKTGALIALIGVGLLLGWNATAVSANFGDLWTPRGYVEVVPGLTATTAFGLFVAICASQTGSLFSSDAWTNITFTAGEVKNPRRNIPLSLAPGTSIVIGLYLLANVAYLVTLPLARIQQAPADRVASATLDAIFPGLGTIIMAVGIMISTTTCPAAIATRSWAEPLSRVMLGMGRCWNGCLHNTRSRPSCTSPRSYRWANRLSILPSITSTM